MEPLKVESVNVNILLFAKAKELMKTPSVLVQLPSKFRNLDDLLEKVESEMPKLKELNRGFVFALNEDYLSEDISSGKNQSIVDSNRQSNEILLKEGDELAIIPPLSGG